jgi:hypothetical protein
LVAALLQFVKPVVGQLVTAPSLAIKIELAVKIQGVVNCVDEGKEDFGWVYRQRALPVWEK